MALHFDLPNSLMDNFACDQNSDARSLVQGCPEAFDEFPFDVRTEVLEALAYVAAGGFPLKAKPLKGAGASLFELALRFRTDAYRTIYAIEFAGAIWVTPCISERI